MANAVEHMLEPTLFIGDKDKVMAEFTLNLEIDNQSLNAIRAAQERIILAKPVGGGSPNVIWQSFDPFGLNTVTWTQEYGLYASDARIVNGASILKISEQAPAEEAHYYSFTSGASFEGPYTDARVGPGQYAADNAMPHALYPQLTFGLTQAAVVNTAEVKSQPLNAVSVLPNRFTVFTPITTVYVWLESNLVSSTVITQITSNHTIVRYSGVQYTRDLVYEPNTGVFVPKKPSTHAAETDVTVVRPLIW
jgi:hypothetical protein